MPGPGSHLNQQIFIILNILNSGVFFLRTDKVHKYTRCLLANRTITTAARSRYICITAPVSIPCVPAYLTVTQTPQTPGYDWLLTLSRTGLDTELDTATRGEAENPGPRGAMGVTGGGRIGVRTSENYVKNHQPLQTPQEGPSEEPEVECHLRGVRGMSQALPDGSHGHPHHSDPSIGHELLLGNRRTQAEPRPQCV